MKCVGVYVPYCIKQCMNVNVSFLFSWNEHRLNCRRIMGEEKQLVSVKLSVVARRKEKPEKGRKC